MVVKSVISYDSAFNMEEMLINTFYTYCFMDPKISVIKDGSPEIVHPDILEEKLNDVKEIVAYVMKYREQKIVSKK